jgi:hypothetical protein
MARAGSPRLAKIAASFFAEHAGKKCAGNEQARRGGLGERGETARYVVSPLSPRFVIARCAKRTVAAEAAAPVAIQLDCFVAAQNAAPRNDRI